MKKNIRSLGVSLLALVYCLSIGLAINFHDYSSDIQYNKNTSKERSFSDYSLKLHFHLSNYKCSVSNFNNSTFPNTKDTFLGFWTVINSVEQLFKAIFSQYSSLERNFLFSQRKADMLFPFHYFW